MLKALRNLGSKRPLVLHPLLFVAYAIFSLLSTNIAQVRIEGLRDLFSTVAIILILLPLLNLFFREPQKTGLLSSVAIVLIFAYSHVKALTAEWQIFGILIGQPLILVALELAIFAIWIYIVYHKLSDVKQVARYFTIVSIVLLIFPVFTIGSYWYQVSSVKGQGLAYAEETWQSTGGLEVQEQMGTQNGEVQRDIYYIILDAYTRQDILEDVFSYDNAWFINGLRERGFYVAENSHSNYHSTRWSLASSLNMVHLDGLPNYLLHDIGMSKTWQVEDSATEILKYNRIGQVLQQGGYDVVSFDTGFSVTEIGNPDHYLVSPQLEGQAPAATAFELLIVDSLFGQLWGDVVEGDERVPLQTMFDAHRERVQFTLQNVDNFANKDGSYFVFAHVLAPHAPFVFGPNGEEIVGTQAYTLSDPRLSYDQATIAYQNQLHYLNSLVLDAIDRILAESETPPIIILQGDHGSKMSLTDDPQADKQSHLDALFPILNAYYLPGGESTKLIPCNIPCKFISANTQPIFWG